MSVSVSATASPAPAERVEDGASPVAVGSRQVALYILIVALVAVMAGAVSVRRDGVFACHPPSEPGRFVSYCQATSYGDYDYGAFWFNLEPGLRDAATSAQVLYLGNSRGQHAFSSRAATEWFADSGTRFFRLGFSHNVNYAFDRELLRQLQPQARVYLINVDLFFEPNLSLPSRAVMSDPAAPTKYRLKRTWQGIQERVCGVVAAACGDGSALYRSRTDGTWVQRGGNFPAVKPQVSYDDTVDSAKVRAYTAAAQGFLPSLNVDPQCVILTLVPTVKTPNGTIGAVAKELGMELVSPRLDSLVTFDGSHLDQASANRWSTAFFAAAGPRIQHCLTAADSFPQPEMSGGAR